jgi:membrane dipeptidase
MTTDEPTLVWDQHGCLPLRPDPEAVEALELYRAAGVDVVSINVGFDLTPRPLVLEIIAAFTRGIAERNDRFVVAHDMADVLEAYGTGRLAVTFDLEGTEPLDGDLSNLAELHRLGVGTMLIAYNLGNRAGGGCHDDPEAGLTAYGRRLLAEMNRLGVVVDATHCSRRTLFDLCAHSSQPVVLSHSVPYGVHAHARNPSDDEIRACAETGGVIGINGVGIFLGDLAASHESLVRAIDYAVELVGPEHVGLGLDYVFDREELVAYIAQNPGTFPEAAGYAAGEVPLFVSPLELRSAAAALHRLGYPESDVGAILGGNFQRVARDVWQPSG